MRRWWKALAIVAGGMLSLGGLLSPAHAQFHDQGGHGGQGGLFHSGPPPAQGKEDPFSMKDDGRPNAFTTLLDVRRKTNHEPIFPHFGRGGLGIFHRTPTAAVAAEFPNCAQPSNEPVSPWTVREEGMPNGFTELCAPRPGHIGHFFHRSRLLFTEMLEPKPEVVPAWCLTFRGEYLAWRIPDGPSNAVLLTTNANPNIGSIGQLGAPGTQILVDRGAPFDFGVSGGYRVTVGLALPFFPPIEVSGFSIRSTATPFAGGSLTAPDQFLAIPFQDVQPGFVIPFTNNVGTETAHVVSIPIGSPLGAQGGSVSISSRLHLWGVEFLGVLPLGCSDCLKCDFLIGYRHLEVTDRLNIDTASGGQVGGVIWLGTILPPGLFMTTTNDQFHVKNQFDGVQLGTRSVLTHGRWSLYGDAKIALGAMRSEVSVNGTSTLSQMIPGRASQTVQGGVLALPSNSGTRSENGFAYAPEVTVSLSFLLHSNIRVFGGYNYLYMSDVARPGSYVSNVIDGRQIPTSAFFTPNLNSSNPAHLPIERHGFTTHGLFVGIEIGF